MCVSLCVLQQDQVETSLVKSDGIFLYQTGRLQKLRRWRCLQILNGDFQYYHGHLSHSQGTQDKKNFKTAWYFFHSNVHVHRLQWLYGEQKEPRVPCSPNDDSEDHKFTTRAIQASLGYRLSFLPHLQHSKQRGLARAPPGIPTITTEHSCCQN